MSKVRSTLQHSMPVTTLTTPGTSVAITDLTRGLMATLNLKLFLCFRLHMLGRIIIRRLKVTEVLFHLVTFAN